MKRRLPRSLVSIRGKIKPIQKINSSTRAENGKCMQTSWSKIKLTITKSGCPVQIRVLTDTQRGGVFFLLLCFFPILCYSLGITYTFLINYLYRLLRQSHKQNKFALSTFMRSVLHTSQILYLEEQVSTEFLLQFDEQHPLSAYLP